MQAAGSRCAVWSWNQLRRAGVWIGMISDNVLTCSLLQHCLSLGAGSYLYEGYPDITQGYSSETTTQSLDWHVRCRISEAVYESPRPQPKPSLNSQSLGTTSPHAWTLNPASFEPSTLSPNLTHWTANIVRFRSYWRAPLPKPKRSCIRKPAVGNQTAGLIAELQLQVWVTPKTGWWALPIHPKFRKPQQKDATTGSRTGARVHRNLYSTYPNRPEPSCFRFE